MKWSTKQEAIFTHVQQEQFASLIVNAVAGSGKTTTIVEVANRLPVNMRGIFLAFNKSIATELGAKLPSYFPAKTFHALGFAILKDRLGFKINVDGYKVSSLIKKAEVNEHLAYPASQLISRAKSYGIGIFYDIDDKDAWFKCLDAAAIEAPPGFTEDQVVQFGITFLKKSNEILNCIDFDDMLYLPLILQKKYQWDLKQYEVIVCDEAQDNNGIQLELLRQLTEKVIAVGDRHQAIYAFRGADYTSMDKLSDAFTCKELPLDVTYRCPLSVVREAQGIVPHIMPADNAEEGLVRDMDMDEFYEAEWGRDTMIICRTNAPIMEVAFRRLKAQQPFTCLSDMPDQMIKYVKTIRAGGINEFKNQLEERHEAKMKELERLGRQSRMNMEHDKFDSIMYLAQQSDSIPMLVNLLEKIMRSNGGPALCTIHKSKGLERAKVVIYRIELCPAPWVVKRGNPEDLQQEENMKYVAITRAQSELTYVHGGDEE